MDLIKLIFQIAIGVGILNVWLVRFSNRTPYRGGGASNMKEEFAAYGLPQGLVWVVGAIKIASAISLLAGIGIPGLVTPAALVLAIFMLSALIFHIKIKDPLFKSVPAATILLLTLFILLV